MAYVTGALLLCLSAVLALVYRSFSQRLAALEQKFTSVTVRRDPAVFAPDAAIMVATPDDLYEVDVTGAWALEQERLGRPVSDAEIAEQRRMWAMEGVA